MGFGTAPIGMVVVCGLVEFSLWADFLVGVGGFDGGVEGDHLLYGVVFHHQFLFEVVLFLSSIVEELLGVVFLLECCVHFQR